MQDGRVVEKRKWVRLMIEDVALCRGWKVLPISLRHLLRLTLKTKNSDLACTYTDSLSPLPAANQNL